MKERMEVELKVRNQSLETKLTEFFGDGAWLLLITALFMPNFLGTWAGNYMASRKQSFLVADRDDGSYISVSAYENGILLSKLEEYAEDHWSLTTPPEVIWLSMEAISGTEMRIQTFSGGIDYTPPKNVQSFGEWWAKNFSAAADTP